MQSTGVIDRFLDVFSRYIDSGFGLLQGEVAFLATTLIVIDVTLAALFWTFAAASYAKPERPAFMSTNSPFARFITSSMSAAPLMLQCRFWTHTNN